MNRASTVDEYILHSPEWQEELLALRQILNDTELEENVKWGGPSYELGGKIVIGMGSFKNWACLWFHHGVFLKDEKKVLHNAQDGKTKGLRQWRFLKNEKMDFDLIRQYVQEAIDNQKAGKIIKPFRAKKITVPEELSIAFKENPTLETAFKMLTPGKRREYAEHIGTAKQASTRQNRLAKCTPMILAGKGLNDKYT